MEGEGISVKVEVFNSKGYKFLIYGDMGSLEEEEGDSHIVKKFEGSH